MILAWLIIILMAGGLLAWVAERFNTEISRWISLLAIIVDAILILVFVSQHNLAAEGWLEEFSQPWIPTFGISFHLSIDGLSAILLMLTFFLGVMAVLISWKEIDSRIGFYHFNLLWVLAGITGVFLTMDLFLFYFFWEVMLIPMYFLIGIWGHENKRYAAYKFFIFTQAGGLLMLLAILALYFYHGAATGTFTFDYMALLNTHLPPNVELWIMLGFLVAFLVKLPVVPFHTWLPDAHSQAPTAGSLILAGLLLKTGAYGLLRFILPLFPNASQEVAPWAMLLGVIGILYGAVLAYAQTDLKRLVAYTSVSHMGFIMLGVFAFNEIALQGVVMQMVAHGISTGALFVIAGCIAERIHTRDVDEMGGFWKRVPQMGAVSMVFVMASLGLPGMANFIAEFLTLVGAWETAKVLTIFAAIGVVGATVYSLRIMQKVFYGNVKSDHHAFPDLSIKEKIILFPMVIVIIVLGLFPAFIFDNTRQSVLTVLKTDADPVKTRNVTSVQLLKTGSHESE
ncbi:MAG TPA: NADH-quinone oxidoreductase subunit M [Chryseosolibacter sp.]|nr:NADH-quinone oxidoreductase subunit M [Chryseosolibacter sp.]